MTLTTEQFVQKAKTIQGDLYSYELVDYENNKIKIKIMCPSHGSFLQRPSDHLNKSGCPECGKEAKGKAKSANAKAEFATKASIIHNNKYTYSLVDYKTCMLKVSITCPIHGEFLQTPNQHLRGRGCPKCAFEESGWGRTVFKEKCDKNNNGLGILYILECFNDTERFYKIGITSRSIKQRYGSISQMPYAYRVIDEIIGEPAYIYDLEIKLHQINKENQYIPSIPFAGHATECFSIYKEN